MTGREAELVDDDRSAGSGPTSRKHRRSLVAIVAFFVLLQLIFIGGAIRIDEPNILEIAKQIAREPADPYGFSINWLGTPQPAWEVLANPPLVPAWLAVAGSLSGWSEPWLRLSILPFGCLALFSFAGLARTFDIEPAMAAALFACTPAFFLCAHLLMPDGVMLALFLTAVWGAVRAEEGSRAAFVIGLAAAFLTPLAKYNGLALVPVLGWYALTAAPTARWRLWALAAMPLLGLGIWSFAGLLMYGRPHVLAVTSHSAGVIPTTAIFATLTYLGCALVPWICLAVRIPHIAGKLDLAFSVLIALAIYAKAWSMYYPLLPSMLFAVAATLGLRVLVSLLTSTAHAPRDRRNVMLVVWIAGPIVLMSGLDFAATRYLLAIAPAAILFLAPIALRHGRRIVIAALGVSAVFCIGLAIGDLRTAEIYRTFADERIPEIRRQSGGRVYFDGHWGFQYYAPEGGAELIDKWRPPVLEPGDTWIIVRNAAPSFTSISGKSAPMELTIERLSPTWPVRTIDYAARANFYATGIRISPREMYLPFGFATGDSERFDIYVARGRTAVRGVAP